MKSTHRHELETNELARRLSVFIDRARPYSSTVLGTLMAIVLVLMGWSYLSGSRAAQREQAWAMYNLAMEGGAPDLQLLRQSAEEHSGTEMQQLADITWADGQVWVASQAYLQNRSVTAEALNRAESMYQSILRSSKDERLLGRAEFGLARVYELQNKLDEARKQYSAVRGDFAELAKYRAQQLEEQKATDTYQWLASVQPQPPVAPAGPGTPGQRPDFSAGDLKLPDATAPAANSTEEELGPATQVSPESVDEALFGPTSSDQPAADAPAVPTGDAEQQ